MSNIVVKSPMQYLDKATADLARVGADARQGRATRPSTPCCKKSPTSIRTGSPSSRGRSARPTSSTRWCASRRKRSRSASATRQIAEGFNSIRDDAKRWSIRSPTEDRSLGAGHQHVDEDLARRHRRPLRPDPQTYLDVTRATKIRSSARAVILDAYRDYRGALKQAEVMALEVLKQAEQKLEAAKAELEAASEHGVGLSGHGAGRARQARADPRRAPAPHPGRGQALPDRQGPLRQPDGLLQHLRGHHGAPDADHERQGARLCPGRHVLLDQRQRADRVQSLVHRHVRPARVDARRWTP